MIALLLLCVVVQYNDPDGVWWMLIYGYGLAVTTMAYFDKYTLLSALGAAGYFLGFVYVVPGWDLDTLTHLTQPKMESIEVELAREAFGMLIAGVWMVALAVVGHRKRAGEALSGSPEAPES